MGKSGEKSGRRKPYFTRSEGALPRFFFSSVSAFRFPLSAFPSPYPLPLTLPHRNPGRTVGYSE